MLVLAIDTALQRCSVAIARDNAMLSHQSLDLEKGHAEHIGEIARLALAEASVRVQDLDRIGVVIGPGGFTGVRVGLSFARGLAIGTDVKVAGVTSLAALAGAVTVETQKTFLAPVIDARRGQVYAGLYDQNGAVIVAPFVASPEDAITKLAQHAGAAPIITLGSGAALIGERPGRRRLEGFDQIDVEAVARLAAGVPASDMPPAPLYLRGPDAKPPKPSPFQQQTTQ